MRIISIEQLSAQFNDGLEDIKMHGLNRIVILAGANGSGKSRFLKRIQYGGYPQVGHQYDVTQFFGIFNFVSKLIRLSDPAQMTKTALVQTANNAVILGTDHLADCTLAHIQHIQNLWWNSHHQWSRAENSNRNQMLQSYELLNELIEVLIGESLDRDSDDNATLFSKPIAQAQLSDGQIALLQWCTALHAQGKELSELILLMDEPENHLHPESMIETLDRIIAANKNGQIWIATHSVPLIAALYKNHSSDVSLYFMDKGKVEYASEKPDKVLNSLMGGKGNIPALREFIDLPEILANYRFAAQCLEQPAVLRNSTNDDPQGNIINSDISSSTSTLKILDFGCGKGRLLQYLFVKHYSDLSSKLDYVGWDDSQKHDAECKQIIEKVYPNDNNRWFCDKDEFFAKYPGQQFDRVILCNVLHEIAPKDWLGLFSKDSIISSSLKDSGDLLIIEDHLMPQGEYAHEFGFIVLDTKPLESLFAASDGKNSIEVRSEREGRIKGHYIPKCLLAKVSAITIKQALQLAQEEAKGNIEKIRNLKQYTYKSGREHGFWVQQYTNTGMALEIYQ
jgi:ABC-type branched-subunit amino acid transport system ATPase component